MTFALALASTGCSRDPEVVARDHMARGDAFAAARQFKEAIIEYGNAVQAKPAWSEAHYKLARVYSESNDPLNAYTHYARAADLDPANVDAQVNAGTLLLAAGEYGSARTRAELALKADATSVPALILLGNALSGLEDSSRALEKIEQAVKLDPSSAPAWTALGAVRFGAGDRAAAGAAFHKAVSLAPASADARLALANYQWASGDTSAAEQTLESALGLDARNASVHRALALLYLTTRRASQAEPHFKALAETEPGGRIALADYYMGLGRNSDALALLQPMAQSSEKDQRRPARLRIAGILYATGRRVEARNAIDELLTEAPHNAEAHTAKARMLLADGSMPADAVNEARAAVSADESLPAAHYALGLALLATGKLDEAETAFGDTVRLNPRAAAAQLQLARIRLARGDPASARGHAEEAARQRPNDPQAAVLVARSLRAQGDLAGAWRALLEAVGKQPDSPATASLHTELGWVALARGQRAVARAEFEKGLRLAPAAIEARTGIIADDLAEGNVAGARGRVDEWRRAATGGDSAIDLLAARVELAGKNPSSAEEILRGIIRRDPSYLEAYDVLGRLYAAQGQTDRAIDQYEALAQRTASATGPRTIAGILLESRGDRARARAQYERVLAADPRAGVAANNLAWIYAEEGRLADAQRLADVARERLGRRPEGEDTAGWVYLKQGRIADAIAAFERARSRAPENPVYHYHAGLAYLQQGDAVRARDSLQRALALGGPFPGADDARIQLARAVTASKSAASR
jgi:tetratricopeptide (TPR) repeat protein